MPRQPGPDHQQIDIPAAVVNRRDDPAVPVDLPEPDHHLFAGYQCGEIRRGFRAERLPEFRRIDFVEPDAERRTVEGVEDRHGIAVRNRAKAAAIFSPCILPSPEVHCRKKKAVHLRTPPPTHTTAHIEDARTVHRLPGGKRYTIQDFDINRTKSKRLRVVFSAVF